MGFCAGIIGGLVPRTRQPGTGLLILCWNHWRVGSPDPSAGDRTADFVLESLEGWFPVAGFVFSVFFVGGNTSKGAGFLKSGWVMIFLQVFLLFLIGCGGSLVACSDSPNKAVSSSASPPDLTKSYIQGLANPNPSSKQVLKQETVYGCVTVPAEGTWQNMWVGFEFTGEVCSVTVGSGNTVSVDFVEGGLIPVKSTSNPQYQTDLFVGELKDNQVLVVQYLPGGGVISVTHTVYNKNNQLVYGQVAGDYIKECILDREEDRRTNKNRSCP